MPLPYLPNFCILFTWYFCLNWLILLPKFILMDTLYIKIRNFHYLLNTQVTLKNKYYGSVALANGTVGN